VSLLLENLGKTAGDETHIADVSFALERGTFNVVLGPARAGKTSLLRLIAGLDSPNSGRILMDGKDTAGVPLAKRKVGMVYQQFINYPNLSAFENIASPLRAARRPQAEIQNKVKSIAAMLQLEDLLSRKPGELSGGQQQRVALARALAKDADIILLDEPLANLDYKLREELRETLPSFFQNSNAVVLYATAEPQEALRLGRDTLVLHEGRLAQKGAASAVYRRPHNIHCAAVFSDPPMNFAALHINGEGAYLGGEATFTPPPSFANLAAGEYTAGVRANHIALSRQSESDAELQTTVAISEIAGAESFIHLDWGRERWVALAAGVVELNPGDALSAYLNPARLFVFGKDGRLLSSPENSDGAN
jgi:glycerol transport system ATP-binding protein